LGCAALVNELVFSRLDELEEVDENGDGALLICEASAPALPEKIGCLV
jgi:hypothetical protein